MVDILLSHEVVKGISTPLHLRIYMYQSSGKPAPNSSLFYEKGDKTVHEIQKTAGGGGGG